MERQFFSGNTLEQALLAAARHHDLEPERIAFKLRDKKHGFVNIRRRVVIEVDPASPEQSESTRVEGEAVPQETAVEREPMRATSDRRSGMLFGGPAGERSAEVRRYDQDRPEQEGQLSRGQRVQPRWRGEESSWEGGDLPNVEAAAVEQAVGDLSDLVGSRATSSIRPDEEGFEIEISGPDSVILREDKGSGLGAIEHLLPRMVRGLSGRGVPCRVDSEGFRVAHEQELERLAQQTAIEVDRARQERRLEPMNPADRRVIHVCLADDPAVRTESEGQGYLKRVRIMPS